MNVKIKNCGLRTAEDIHAAAMSGASYVGFVHHAASPRHLGFEAIADLSESVPPTLQQVVVMVDPSDESIAELQRYLRPHFLQLHGIAHPGRIEDIAKRTAIPIIAAVAIRTREDTARAAAFEPASAHLLLDGAHPGSGRPFDWSLLTGLALKKTVVPLRRASRQRTSPKRYASPARRWSMYPASSSPPPASRTRKRLRRSTAPC
ncbi:MAG: hypothetical protein WDN72_05835 [Alphaproteobacteria bacterium]